MSDAKTEQGRVLVGVLKDKRDLGILRKRHWYRIPVSHAPKRKFEYVAFYQPVSFGRRGKRIDYYARVLNIRSRTRQELLPRELHHPRAQKQYLWIRFGEVKVLPRPIKNLAPRRISFGFTTLRRLVTAKNILQLYNIAPTEQVIGAVLKRSDISAIPQYYIAGGKRGVQRSYRLDFAIMCERGNIAVECDNTKAHAGIHQREKDRAKDALLRRRGWKVVRLKEKEIVADLSGCLRRIQTAIRALGGQQKTLH